ncbi:caspase, EACC1-associated type [Nonomuraea sediminis]|uniref:caspase, EACC1-associated type n=1 Tax=Nonomuraea sediminis TaxID=2835864 RepID=UPI001BDBB3AB|nr:AAA family ATPase [Nonomuraea sediminis]
MTATDPSLVLAAPGARVLLAGSATHAAGSILGDRPSVAASVADLGRCLTDRAGLDPAHLSVLVDPADPATLATALSDLAGQAEDVLVFGYVGHGVLDDDGELHLATRATIDLRRGLAAYQALPYAVVRQILAHATARLVLVLVDCCFAGLADGATSAEPPGRLFDHDQRGMYVLASTGPREQAWAPPGETYTSFTGALISLITGGDPIAPAVLTIDDCYRSLSRVMTERDLPRPHRRVVDAADRAIVFANRAHLHRQGLDRRGPPVTPVVSARLGRSAPREEASGLPGSAAAEDSDQPGLTGTDQPDRFGTAATAPAAETPTPASAPSSTTTGGPKTAFSPYRGLAAFGPEDAEFFFGREELTRSLIDRVAAGRGQPGPLVVTGASGAGKSSLLRAGLLTALRTARTPAVVFTPTGDPLGQLARQLASLGGATGVRASVDADHLRERLREDPQAAGDLLAALEARPVIVVDQFEELFTATLDEDVRRASVQALHAASTQAGVVVAVRADFFGHCAAYPLLVPALEHALVVGPMSETHLRQAIEKPARKAGLELESGLVELLLDDVGASPGRPASAEGTLPLLSHALLSTWQHSPEAMMTLAGYRASGGVAGALAQSADTTLAHLPLRDRATARTVLTTLVRLGDEVADTRRKVTHTELVAVVEESERPAVQATLDRFTDARLISQTAEGAELTHEALIRAWPQLQEWLDADRAALIARQRLADDARQWDHHDRNPAFLYRGTRLAQAPRDDRASPEAAGPGPAVAGTGRAWLSEVERDFLAAARRLARRGRRVQRLVIITLAVLVIVSLTASAVAFNAARNATDVAQQARQASRQALSRQLAAQSIGLSDFDGTLSQLLAVAARTQAPTSDARLSLLNAAVNPARGILTGHQGAVYGVVFSPDGRTLASAGYDGTIRLWDAATRRQIGSLIGHQGAVNGVVFSPDGRTLASAGADGTIRLWDTATRRQIGSSLIGHQGGVYGVVFSPDGRILASAGYDGTIRLWDAATRRQIGSPLIGHQRGVNGVVFSPDGHTLASAGYDATIRLWDAATHRQIGSPLIGHQRGVNGVNGVVFSPDGRTLASSGADGTIRLWDAATHRQIGSPLIGHQGGVNGVVFSLDGRTLASGGHDGTIRLWDAAAHRQIGSPLNSHQSAVNGVNGVVFSPDGRTLASSGADGTIRLWDAATHRQIGSPLTGHRSWVNGVVFSPDGRTLASSGADGTIRLWDAATHRQIGSPLAGRQDAVSGVVFSPDGHTLASAGYDTTIRLWDAATHRQIGSPLTGHQGGVNGVVFSPDGRTLASAGTDATIRLWDAATHRQIGSPLNSHQGVVYGVVFSPDGRTLASTGTDGTVRLWDAATRRQIGSLTGHQGGVSGVVFSPDGRTLASTGTDATIRLWDAATHRQIGSPLTGHQDAVYGVVFSPDGRTLASAGADATIRLWDTATHRQIGSPPTGHQGGVSGVVFSPDGHTLASAGYDATIRLWDAKLPDDPLSAVCAAAGRPLTQEEWSQYAPGEPYQAVCPHSAR